MEFISQNAESARSMDLGLVSGVHRNNTQGHWEAKWSMERESEERRCVRTRVTLSSDSDRLPLPPSLITRIKVTTTICGEN